MLTGIRFFLPFRTYKAIPEWVAVSMNNTLFMVQMCSTVTSLTVAAVNIFGYSLDVQWPQPPPVLEGFCINMKKILANWRARKIVSRYCTLMPIAGSK